MAHHRSTPKSVLNAPQLRPDPVWTTTVMGDKLSPGIFARRRVRPAFVGDVERDLLGVTVGRSRKGRKVRRGPTRPERLGFTIGQRVKVGRGRTVWVVESFSVADATGEALAHLQPTTGYTGTTVEVHRLRAAS